MRTADNEKELEALVRGWNLEYAASRYLREQDEAALQRRYEDLTTNLWSTDKAGNIVRPRHRDHRLLTLSRIAHLLCEKAMRIGEHRFCFDEKRMREHASRLYKPPMLKPPFAGELSCLAKFGSKVHIRAAFCSGRLQISPAAKFADPSLNAARKDDELTHWAITPNERLAMTVYGRSVDEPEGTERELPFEGKELLRGLMVPNFYVWCCGREYDARLFHEFEADAVIVIRDIDEFRKRLASAVNEMFPQWSMSDGPVTYYDPYSVRAEQLVPLFMKHMRYLHQYEYRFAWTLPPDQADAAFICPPRGPSSDLEPIYPMLGPLSDIAEYYEFEGPT